MIVFAVPPAVGGTVLIIDRIESQNFITNVSGWAIRADGTAEFFNLISRGSFIGGTVGGKRVEINGSFVPGGLAFYTGAPTETLAGVFDPNTFTPPSPTTPLNMRIRGPRQGGATAPYIDLQSDQTVPNSNITLGADSIDLVATAASGTNATTALTMNRQPVVTTSVGTPASKVERGTGSFTVNASGAIAIPHGLGVVPVVALESFQNSSFYGAADLNSSTATTVNVFVRNILSAGALVASGTVVVCRYFFIT